MVLLSPVLIGLFFLLGYSVRIPQRVMREDSTPLPDWSDFGAQIVLGFRYVVLYVVCLLPIIAVALILYFLGIITGVTESKGTGVSLLLLFYVVLFFATVPYAIAPIIFTSLITIRFAERDEIGDG
ncbi:MAG: DUF4013 domain-containing protein [Bacteroidota bacterium]